jgi:osmotically-inducible protein OsmY
MGWLKRLFGMEQAPAGATPSPAPMQGGGGGGQTAEAIAPERVGLNGEYDQSGLAKRVALAFDQDAQVKDVDSVFVAQTGGTVVLKGKAPSQAILDRLASIARGVSGATAVDASQVTIG